MIKPATTSERTILGAVMRWADVHHDLNITPEDFSEERYALANWVFRSPGLGLEVVRQRMEDAGDIETSGGYEELNDCFLACPSNADGLEEHAAIVRERRSRRLAHAAGTNLAAAASDVSESTYVAAMGQPITEAMEAALGLSQKLAVGDMIKQDQQDMVALLKGEKTPMGVPTGIWELDSRFRGLHPAHLIVVSGYPGGGKTVLAAQLAWAAASAGHATLFNSLEITGQQLIRRLLVYAAGIDGAAAIDPKTHIEEGGVPIEAFAETLSRGYARINSASIDIEDMAGADMDRIVGTIRRAHRKSPLKLAVVDFIQRVRATREMVKSSREQQLSVDANRLADLAKELGITIVVPSQLNKEGAAKHAEAINEAADLHLRIEPEWGIKVVKDRHFGQGGRIIPLALDSNDVKFAESEKPEYEPETRASNSRAPYND